MTGLVTKSHLLEVFKTFGFSAALRLLTSREKTFLAFCVKNHLI